MDLNIKPTDEQRARLRLRGLTDAEIDKAALKVQTDFELAVAFYGESFFTQHFEALREIVLGDETMRDLFAAIDALKAKLGRDVDSLRR